MEKKRLMTTAKSYKDFLDLLERLYGGGEKIVCLFFADPSNNFLTDYLDRRFDYFSCGTGAYADFFFPGYNYERKGIYGERKFCSDAFAAFVRRFEELTSWRYGGGTSLLFLRWGEGRLHFDKAYEANLARLFIDGFIKDYRQYIEETVSRFKSRAFAERSEEFSEKCGGGLWANFSEAMPLFFGIDGRGAEDIDRDGYFLCKDINAR